MAKRYTIAISVITTGARKSAKEIRELEGSSAAVAKSLNVAKLAATAFGGVLASQFARAGMAMETLKSRLNDPTAFKALSQFAKDTGQNIDGVVNGFVKLRNLGIDPTMERMKAFGNVAAAQGKSLEQFVEAVADAATNEFERLKEFGIKARQETEDVVFTFKGMETRVKKDSDSIVGYLERIGEVEFAGELERQAKTSEAAIRSLKNELADIAGILWGAGPKQATTALAGGIRQNLELMKQGLGIVRDYAKESFHYYTGGHFKKALDEAGEEAAQHGPIVAKLVERYQDLAKASEDLVHPYEAAANAAWEQQKALDELARIAKVESDAREARLQELRDENAELERNIGLLTTQYELYGNLRFGGLEGDLPAFGVGEINAGPSDADIDRMTREVEKFEKINATSEEIRFEWEGIAGTVTDIVRSLKDGTADWLDYLNMAADLFVQIAEQQARTQGGAGGQSAGQAGSGAVQQGASAAGYSGVSWAVAIYTAIYDAWSASIERNKGRIYSLPISTSAAGLNAQGGQAIGGGSNSAVSAAEVAKIHYGLKQGLEAILQAIGGFVTDMGDLEVAITQNGEKFRASVDGYILGVYDSLQDAVEAATAYALKTAEFEGITDNMRAALSGYYSSLEEMMNNINLANWIDQLGMTDLEIEIQQMSRQFLKAAEDARRLGMDVGAVSDGFISNMESIRNRILGIHKSEYDQRLEDAEAFNNQIRERIAQLRRYFEQLAQEALIPTGGGGIVDGGPGSTRPRFGEIGNSPYGGLGGVNGVGSIGIGSMEDVFGPGGLLSGAEDAAGTFAGAMGFMTVSVLAAADAVDGELSPAMQAILDEIAALEGMLIDPAEVKKGGGGGSGRREDIKRFREEIERLQRVAGGPVTEALFAVNDNFDRLEAEARRLRQPLDEIVALRDREVEALREQARNEFIDTYVNFVNSFGDIEQAMMDIGSQADAVRSQIDDLLEAGVINAEQAEALLAEVQAAQNRRIQDVAQNFANDTLFLLYDYLDDEKATAELRWTLAQAEMELRLAQLEIARRDNQITQEVFDHIQSVWNDVLAAGNPFIGDGTGGGGTGDQPYVPGDDSSVDNFLGRLADIGSRDFSSIAAMLDAWKEFQADNRSFFRSPDFIDEIRETFASMVDAMEDVLIQPIRDLREEILSDELGPLSARERFERMQTEYRDVLARAQGGDLDAIQQYADVARQFRSVYQEFQGNAAAGWLDAQMLSMLQQFEGLDLTGELVGQGLFPQITAELGPGGPMGVQHLNQLQSIDMRGAEQVDLVREQNEILRRIERNQVDERAMWYDANPRRVGVA